MPRRYWRAIITAILAVLILPPLGYVAYQLYDAAEQRNSSYQYQPAAQPSGSVVGTTKPPAKPYQPKCKNPQSDGDADLCAQWAAVQQVGESNRLASLNAQMAVLSLLATAAATMLLVWTLWETRSTSRRELRAYIFPENVGIYCMINQRPISKNGKVGSTVHIKNSGQTPAYDVRHWSEVTICLQADEENLIPESMDSAQSNSMPPNGIITASRRMAAKLTRNQQKGLKDGNLGLYVYGRIDYRDAFGRNQATRYKFASAIWPLPENITMSFAATGNTAT